MIFGRLLQKRGKFSLKDSKIISLHLTDPFGMRYPSPNPSLQPGNGTHCINQTQKPLTRELVPPKMHNCDQARCQLTQDKIMALQAEGERHMDAANNKHPLNISGTSSSQLVWILSTLKDRKKPTALAIYCYNKLPPNLAAQNNKHLLFHSIYESGIRVSHEGARRMSAGAACISRLEDILPRWLLPWLLAGCPLHRAA